MGEIRRTGLATSTPRNLTIGFPFAARSATDIDTPLSPVVIGIGATPSLSQPLFNVNIPLLLWRVRGTLSAQLVLGAFVGFNLGYQVQGGTFSFGEAEVLLTDVGAQGGCGFGAGFTLSFGLVLEESRIRFTWASGFRTTWERVFSITPSATIDLIRILLDVVSAAGVRVPLETIDEGRQMAGSGAIWGLFDSVSIPVLGRGSIELRPRLSLSANILSLITPMQAPLKALKNAGGKLFVGPQLNIVFPLTIDLVRLTTEDGSYDIDPDNTRQIFVFKGGPSIPIDAPDVQSLTMTHAHRLGVLFTLEFRASFSMWSIFSLSASIPINLTALFPFELGARGLIGPFYTALSNQPVAAAELPEVIWG